MSLIVLANFKAFIHMDENYDDVLLQNIINAEELNVANNRIHQSLEQAETTEYHDGDRTNTIILNNGLVTAVAHVKTDDDCDGTYENTLDADEYVWYENGIIQLHAGWFQAQKKLIEVKYTHGYTAGTLPSDLQFTLMKIMANTYQKSRVAIEDEGTGSIFSQKEIEDGLKKYRRINI
jgi:hypothetical protein